MGCPLADGLWSGSGRLFAMRFHKSAIDAGARYGGFMGVSFWGHAVYKGCEINDGYFLGSQLDGEG